LVFELNGSGNEQALLRAAQRAGPVRHSSEIRPTLTDLFRHVVSAERAGEKAAPAALETVYVDAA
jgi:ABC-2 type transport system ATP-binding protein